MESLKVNDHENFADLSSFIAVPVDIVNTANAVTVTAFVKSVGPLFGTAADSSIAQKKTKKTTNRDSDSIVMPGSILDSSDDSSDEEDKQNNQQTHESRFTSRVSRSVDANAVNDHDDEVDVDKKIFLEGNRN